MSVFVTELTLAKPAAEFLLEYECKRYQTYSRELLTGREKGELLREIKR